MKIEYNKKRLSVHPLGNYRIVRTYTELHRGITEPQSIKVIILPKSVFQSQLSQVHQVVSLRLQQQHNTFLKGQYIYLPIEFVLQV